jgi:rhodanese-related sulfurtransferase
MRVKEITPQEAFQILQSQKNNVKLIDIRECVEYEEERIPGACLVPMKSLAEDEFKNVKERIGIFYCRSGRRTDLLKATISNTGFEKVYILKGGLNAWKKAGFPVLKKQNKIPNVLRQTFIVIGLALLIFSLLSLKISPDFIIGAAVVGCGLIFAGVSGSCLLAMLINKLPWNKHPYRYKICENEGV